MCGSSAGASTIAVEGDVDDTPDVQDLRPRRFIRHWAASRRPPMVFCVPRLWHRSSSDLCRNSSPRRRVACTKKIVSKFFSLNEDNLRVWWTVDQFVEDSVVFSPFFLKIFGFPSPSSPSAAVNTFLPDLFSFPTLIRKQNAPTCLFDG